MSDLRAIEGDAIVLSGGILDSGSAKTTHGLARGSTRFNIKSIIDSKFAGQPVENYIGRVSTDIPIHSTVQEYLHKGGTADYCIIGVATKGGVLPDQMRRDVIDALNSNISIVNGLHKFLNDDEEFAAISVKNGVPIHDIRKPRPKNELSFWTGDIFKVGTPKIAVLGTDCGLGKRTTAKFIVDKLREEGHTAEMIYTGQTGWLQGWRYGFILDSTVNDFVSGELEDAIIRCYDEVNPDFMIMEGQAALRNISGPCGAEFLISGDADAVVLHHSPVRKYYHGYDHLGIEIPPLEKEVELVEAYGRKVIGVTLNTHGVEYDDARNYRDDYSARLNLPVALPMEEGIDAIVSPIIDLKEKVRIK